MNYHKIRYPDGQISAFIDSYAPPLVVRERIRNYEDLMYVVSLAEVLGDKNDRFPFRLEAPYLFGQRSDRRFDANQSLDLKVIAKMINGCRFASVTVLDPHANLDLVINNLVISTPFPYIKETVDYIGHNDLILVSPDAGAYKKTFDLAEKLNLPLVAAVKHRDIQGTIDQKFIGDVQGKSCLIVDDLADGGYTFYLLGKTLKSLGAVKVYLYVTHGMFSKGFDSLKEYIDGIFCTNSFMDIENELIRKQYKVI